MEKNSFMTSQPIFLSFLDFEVWYFRQPSGARERMGQEVVAREMKKKLRTSKDLEDPVRTIQLRRTSENQ